MAYILPITHYDYNNYQKRIDHDKRDPFHIEALAQVQLNTGLTLRKPTLPPDDIYARITGKGQDFNESI